MKEQTDLVINAMVRLDEGRDYKAPHAPRGTPPKNRNPGKKYRPALNHRP